MYPSLCPGLCLQFATYLFSLLWGLCWATTMFTCASAFPVLMLETRCSPEAAVSPLNPREVPPWFWSISGCLGKRSPFQKCFIAGLQAVRSWQQENVLQVLKQPHVPWFVISQQPSYLPILHLPVCLLLKHLLNGLHQETPRPTWLVGGVKPHWRFLTLFIAVRN